MKAYVEPHISCGAVPERPRGFPDTSALSTGTTRLLIHPWPIRKRSLNCSLFRSQYRSHISQRTRANSEPNTSYFHKMSASQFGQTCRVPHPRITISHVVSRRSIGSVSAIDSGIFRSLFGTEETCKVSDDKAYIKRCVDAKAALARE
ncbi:uncharacterized protein BO87DRAFT_226260 [Aspergillus neoniger CBS 115656]|uniref:Uncharacterized protein n=1 Tax=Aspergillus neoniger (strain CBS 115656) TaxID=1448310 RepID=A0A318YQI8_ASPNB|nr:hypothetical protein BO87DRAFT_226260 [Aspergillus neoniger CBS 115656]PYH36594.1 hypothetical protein BO87DRAFT_226260 [Aspergillus neoniger CBS 115656]